MAQEVAPWWGISLSSPAMLNLNAGSALLRRAACTPGQREQIGNVLPIVDLAEAGLFVAIDIHAHHENVRPCAWH